jgi:hypothetical protein
LPWCPPLLSFWENAAVFWCDLQRGADHVSASLLGREGQCFGFSFWA